MRPTTQIVALAARVPVGLRAESSAAAVRAGISRVMGHGMLVDACGEPLACGCDGRLDPALRGVARLEGMLDGLMAELGAKLCGYLPGDVPVPMACWLALPEPRPGFDAGQAEALRQAQLGKALPHCPAQQPVWHAVLQGHAGGVCAMEQALDELASGRSELCVVVGLDSYLEADTLDWLESERRVMRDGIRGAFPPGEGAAAIVLANAALVRRLRFPVLAELEGLASGTDPADADSDVGLLGRGLSDVYDRVAAQLPAGSVFDDVFSDINDERARTTDYGFALLRSAAHFRDGTQYTTCVGQTGELGAASAVFNCVLATCSLQGGYAKGPRVLVSSASWNGLRGAVVLGKGRG